MDCKYFQTKDELSLKICCLTYNLHGISLTKSQINELLTPHKRKKFDIYVISTQESERNIFWNLLYWDKSKFEMNLAQFFGQEYVRLHPETLGGVYLIIFLKSIHKN